MTAPFECYVYWRLRAETLPAAARAMAAFQEQLRARHPGLQARLLSKMDSGDAEATLMEVYTLPGGVSSTLDQAVADEGGRVAAPWCLGQRHIERFSPLSL